MPITKEKSLSNAKNLPLVIDKEYKTLLVALKTKIRSARLKTILSINREVIYLYWHIGNQILTKQHWGSKFINTLSNDLRNAFPKTTGFSIRNLQRMRQFSVYYPSFEIVPQAVPQLPLSTDCNTI